MINIFVYFLVMFILSLYILGLSWGFYYEDYGMIFEWKFLSYNSMDVEFMVHIDWLSMLFISFIFLISSMIMLYSYEYMSDSKFISRFIYLVVLFVMSMILMIISPSLVSILFGWDGLGLVSYCLIIYYHNYSSYNSGMVTVLCNRIGDIGLLMCIALMLMKGSWNMWSLTSGDWLVTYMLILSAITKSAQFPFSPWLPMAMAAPTPVSALVHSSTLVTAGVYLMVRFSSIVFVEGENTALFSLSVLTMFSAGLMAVVEYDLKKIIALSTLSQLGLMMMILSLGYEMLAFYHLLTHAIFKSMLFMCAGIIIHSMMDNQDIRLLGNLNYVIPFTMMSFLISNLALCGAPFMAGFYSKDLIMESIYISKVNMLMLFLIIFSLMFTVFYSLRLSYYLFFSNMMYKGAYYSLKESMLMSGSMMVLVTLSVFIGSLLSWLFFFDYYQPYMEFEVKIITLGMCILGVMVGLIEVVFNFLAKFYYFSYFLNFTMFLNYLYSFSGKIAILGGVYTYEVDKTWLEYYMKNFVTYFIKFLNKFVKNYLMCMYISGMIFSVVWLAMAD